MVVAGDLDSSKLSTADCLSSFVLQNSMADPACEGLQLSKSRDQHLCAIFDTVPLCLTEPGHCALRSV